MGMKPKKIETQAFLNRNDDDESPGREWIKGLCVCVCLNDSPTCPCVRPGEESAQGARRGPESKHSFYRLPIMLWRRGTVLTYSLPNLVPFPMFFKFKPKAPAPLPAHAYSYTCVAARVLTHSSPCCVCSMRNTPASCSWAWRPWRPGGKRNRNRKSTGTRPMASR